MTGHCIHRVQGTSMVPATEATLREQQWGYYKDTGGRRCSQNQGAGGTSMPEEPGQPSAPTNTLQPGPRSSSAQDSSPTRAQWPSPGHGSAPDYAGDPETGTTSYHPVLGRGVLKRELRGFSVNRGRKRDAPGVPYRESFSIKALSSLAWPPHRGLRATTAYFKDSSPTKNAACTQMSL